MNAVFADTSALLALLDAKDENHARAESEPPADEGVTKEYLGKEPEDHEA